MCAHLMVPVNISLMSVMLMHECATKTSIVMEGSMPISVVIANVVNVLM